MTGIHYLCTQLRPEERSQRYRYVHFSPEEVGLGGNIGGATTMAETCDTHFSNL